MRLDVGVQVGEERGQVTVHPHQIEKSECWTAVEFAMALTQEQHPTKKIEFMYVKEWWE